MKLFRIGVLMVVFSGLTFMATAKGVALLLCVVLWKRQMETAQLLDEGRMLLKVPRLGTTGFISLLAVRVRLFGLSFGVQIPKQSEVPIDLSLTITCRLVLVLTRQEMDLWLATLLRKAVEEWLVLKVSCLAWRLRVVIAAVLKVKEVVRVREN